MEVEKVEKRIEGKFRSTIIILFTLFLAVVSLVAFRYFNSVSSADKVTVSGSYIQEVDNTIANLYFNTRTRNADKQVSENQNNEKVNKLLEKLKSLGIEEKDIKTTGYFTYRDVEYYTENNVSKSRETDWITAQDIEVIVRNKDLVNTLITETSIEDITISGPNYTVDENFDDSQIYDLAFEKAKLKAKSLAEVSKRSLGKVVEISEVSTPVNNFLPLGGALMKAEDNVQASLPAGTSKIQRTVLVTFELE
jgi:uncharacterized protein